MSRDFNDQIKRLAGEVKLPAKEVEEEQAQRDATNEEAPWQGLMGPTGGSRR